MPVRRLSVAVVAIGGLFLGSCARPAPARRQLVVVVDTDAPVPTQVAADPALSGDAVVDTVRVDIVDEKGKVVVFREFVAADVRDWPLSFGIVPDGGPSAAVQLRIRAFEGALGTPGTNDGTATLDPPPESSIDRVVRLPYPEDGVATVRVVLRSDCRGRPASFLSPVTTCVDASTLQATPDAGVESLAEGALPEPIVGSWAGAREKPCSGASPSGAVCIPGGFTMLGDKAIAGAEDGIVDLSPLPHRLALLSPFHLDRTEFTVGRFRQLVAAGRIPTALPTGASSSLLYCTWRGVNDASNDAMPLNCVPGETLASSCAAVGGSLPSEAQWEHAARGRGQRRSFPWGEATPQCCTASLSRKYTTNSTDALCDALGVEPAGSHVRTAGCPGGGDVSRDGVLDLAGSLEETVLDAAHAYSDPCWGQGVLQDPVCLDPMVSLQVGRGADWTAGPARGRGAFRGQHTTNSDLLGFRCAYPDGAP